MSFLDGLFGGAASRRDTAAADARAREALAGGRSRALAALNGAIDPARADINAGYDQADQYVNTGMTGATDALTRGYDTARGDLTGNYGRAEDAITGGVGRARDLLNPLILLGGQYDQMYGDALGANGADARTAFYDQNVTGNDQFGYADELAAKQIEAKLNASGITGGRAGALQIRQGAQRVEDRTNQYLDRIKEAGNRGAQFAGQAAGLEANAGTQIGQLRAGLGDRLSGLETGRGAALGNVQLQGNQSLAGMASDRGTALGNLGMSNAARIAGIESDYGNTTAANAINVGNANAASRGQGMNALMSLAGTAIKGFTPGLNGVSAFGSMANTLFPPKPGQWRTTTTRDI